ncbi:MAG: FHA domain-containing protein [Planctomycetota bacterium]
MIQAKLIVVGGDAKRAEVTLKNLPTTIGRAKDASITLPHSLVSRKHCEIFESNNSLFVKDLNSLNGTYLNNEKISEPKPLLSGQLLTLGNVTFRAVYEQESKFNTEQPGFASSDNKPAGNQSVDPVNKQKDLNNASSIPAEVLQEDEPDTDAGRNDQEYKQQIFSEDPIVTPRIFDEEIAELDRSISIEAIGNLPNPSPQASFAASIDFGEESPGEIVDDSAIHVHTDQSDQNQIDPSQSSLDSFFRKLPK